MLMEVLQLWSAACESNRSSTWLAATRSFAYLERTDGLGASSRSSEYSINDVDYNVNIDFNGTALLRPHDHSDSGDQSQLKIAALEHRTSFGHLHNNEYTRGRTRRYSIAVLTDSTAGWRPVTLWWGPLVIFKLIPP